MGKFNPEDQLNCNACGYPTCRENAIAILEGRAELNMCVSFMRKLAENKANSLLKADPNGIVIVNEKLEILTSNPSFERMFRVQEGQHPHSISDLMPDDDFFDVLTTSKTVTNKLMHFPEINLTVQVTIFPIEEYRFLGAIFNDISDEEERKKELNNLSETTIGNAHKIINNQMQSAQQMARMLGDVTADTKILLNDLIKLAEKFKR